MLVLTGDEARRWLDGYGAAWINRDVELAASLFHEDVLYRERRFTRPIRGRDKVRRYWENRVRDYQTDIEYSYELWAVKDNTCFASFEAVFTWIPISGRIEIDGVFRLSFSSVKDGMPICDSFEEWFDLRES